MPGIENTVGSMEPEHFLKQSRRTIFLDYLIATSTHGLRSVGRSYSTYNRFFWVAIFTAAFGLMFYFIISTVLEYFAFPTQTNVEILMDLTMPFPAVTICSGTPYRYDTINASLVAFVHRVFPPNTTLDQNTINSLAIPLLVDLFNRNQTKEMLSASFHLSDMLLACSYNGIDCSNAFTLALLSALGNCYTFNWKASTELFKLNDYGNTLVVKEGLQLTFYIPQESYLPVQYDIGLTVLLHDNNELPVPSENGISLQPGLSHLITFRKSKTTFLPPPYTQCTSAVSKDLQVLYQTTFFNQTASTAAVYSESVCRELCEQAYIFSQCSCIFPLPFLTRKVLTIDGDLVSTNCCNPFTNQTQCAFSAKQQFAASEQLQLAWCYHCAPQCVHTNFYSSVSAQSAPSNGTKEYWASKLLNGNNSTTVLFPHDFAQKFDYYFDRNYLSVLVSCGSKYVTEYKQEAKLTLGDVFSSIGGQTGLWIGLSVLSIIELGEVAYRLIHKSLTRNKGQRTIHVTPMTITMNRS